MQNFVSDISNNEYPISERVHCSTIRKSLLELIQKEHPSFTKNNCISKNELNHYREKYIADYISKQVGELSALEEKVVATLNDNATISNKIDDDDLQTTTFGQRIADKVASFGGSWTFIISFGIFILFWISINIIVFANKGFDPYPFILLNLILSCIAALQAPVIMMSQNRQEEKDRTRAKKDYMINLKAELEINMLNEKIDHLIIHQQQELLEIQKVQIEMMNDILSRIENKN